MERLFAAVLAVTCVVGSTPSYAQAGIAYGSGRGGPTTLLQALAPRVLSSENRILGAPVSQLPAFAPRVLSSENRILGAPVSQLPAFQNRGLATLPQTPQALARANVIQGVPLPQVPGSENQIVGIPLPPAAQAPIVNGPSQQTP
jgi:hypothetical protein